MNTSSKIAAIALAASGLMALSAGSASAAAVGTIDVTGAVGAKCMVLPSGATTFTGTLGFGELSGADGTLAPSTSTQSTSFEVVCNTAAPTVTISATPMTAQNNPTTTAGYSSTVDYTAEVNVLKATSGSATFSYKTVDGTALGGEPSTGPVGDRIKVISSNLTVTASALATRGGTANILAADTSYKGVITVTVSPS